MKTKRVVSWESHLIRRAALGESVAFEILCDMYRPVLTSLAMRMLRNSDDASDAVQEAFLKAFRAIKDFDPDRPLRPWLCRICSNCCVDAVRSRRFEKDSLENHEHVLQDKSENIDDKATGLIRQTQVIDAIARLPEKYRRIIFMRHFKHMDVSDIAFELDKPEGTIKSWLFRARALLRKDLKMAIG